MGEDKDKDSPFRKKLKIIKDKAIRYLGLDMDTEDEPTTRQEHFKRGSTEHETDIINHSFDTEGIAPEPFKKDNVSSIMNAFEQREKKTPPEGYEY
jgi:hypothetical protein